MISYPFSNTFKRSHWFTIIFILGFCLTSESVSAENDSSASLIVLYPGFSDNGISKVDLIRALKPGLWKIVVVTERSATEKYKQKWKNENVLFLDDRSVTNKGGFEAALQTIKQDKVRNIIVNIDMDVGPDNFMIPDKQDLFLLPIGKGRKEQRWAGKTGSQIEQAFRKIYGGDAIVGVLSHSYGNGAFSEALRNGSRPDFGIMASPAAKRTTLNRIAEKVKDYNLLVLTAEGDFHGPISIDGPTNFKFIKLLQQENPHSSMVLMKNLTEDTNYETNWGELKGRPIIDFYREIIQSPSKHLSINKDEMSLSNGDFPPQNKNKMDVKQENLTHGKERVLRSTPSRLILEDKIAVGRDTAENLASAVLVFADLLENLDDTERSRLPGIRNFKDFSNREKLFLKSGTFISEVYNLVLDIEADIRDSKDHRVVFLSSHSLEGIGGFGLKLLGFLKLEERENIGGSAKFMASRMGGFREILIGLSKQIGSGKPDTEILSHYIDGLNEWLTVAMENDKRIPKGVPSFLNLVDGLKGLGVAWIHSKQRGQADVEVITESLDAINSLAWTALGLVVCEANSSCTAVVQKFGTTAAEVLRGITFEGFRLGVLFSRKQSEQLISQWYSLQQRNITMGLAVKSISEVYGVDLLKKNGLSEKQILELDDIAERTNAYSPASKDLSNNQPIQEHKMKSEDSPASSEGFREVNAPPSGGSSGGPFGEGEQTLTVPLMKNGPVEDERGGVLMKMPEVQVERQNLRPLRESVLGTRSEANLSFDLTPGRKEKSP